VQTEPLSINHRLKGVVLTPPSWPGCRCGDCWLDPRWDRATPPRFTFCKDNLPSSCPFCQSVPRAGLVARILVDVPFWAFLLPGTSSHRSSRLKRAFFTQFLWLPGSAKALALLAGRSQIGDVADDHKVLVAAGNQYGTIRRVSPRITAPVLIVHFTAPRRVLSYLAAKCLSASFPPHCWGG